MRASYKSHHNTAYAPTLYYQQHALPPKFTSVHIQLIAFLKQAVVTIAGKTSVY